MSLAGANKLAKITSEPVGISNESEVITNQQAETEAITNEPVSWLIGDTSVLAEMVNNPLAGSHQRTCTIEACHQRAGAGHQRVGTNPEARLLLTSWCRPKLS
jgi:hypothetical protein